MGKIGILLAGLGFVLAFVGGILLICALVSLVKTNSFAKRSQRTTGRVGNKYVHHGNNRRTYSMSISYTADGVSYERSVPASAAEHDTLQAGDSFEILYRTDKPKKILRADSLSEQSVKKLRALLLTSIVMTVLGLALLLLRIFTV